jgi:septal ring factor EnvC (AmiA/AmiB activator)
MFTLSKGELELKENPLAIRTTEDAKARFADIAASGDFDSKGELFERMLTLYESEAAKEKAAKLKPAIETVEVLMSRLFEVLNGAAAAIATDEERQERELAKQRDSFAQTQAMLQERIDNLEKERADFGGLAEKVSLLEAGLADAERKLEAAELEKSRALLELETKHNEKYTEAMAGFAEKLQSLMEIGNLGKGK